MKLFSAIEPTPGFFALASKLEHHGQRRGAAAAAFCLARPVTDGGETRFDRIGRPQMNPVLGRKIVKAQQHRTMLFKARARFVMRCLEQL